MRAARAADDHDEQTVVITMVAICAFLGLLAVFLAFHADFLWAAVVALADLSVGWLTFRGSHESQS